MKVPFTTPLARIAILALMLPAGLLAAQNSDSTAISKLLHSAKAQVTAADREAATLESFYQSGLSSGTHGVQLNLVKEHLNNLIRDGNALSSMRGAGSPWQQKGIDQITALLPEMADHLTATINHHNENLSRTNMQPYREYVLKNRALIQNARETIARLVDYGKAKQQLEALQERFPLHRDVTAPGA